MGDIKLREEIAKAIVESELIALFENGVYDPDGHLGNWPIDVENKEIVRIDYAQLRAIPEEERVAFRKVFSELIKPSPDFSSREMAHYFSGLLESDAGQEELVDAIQSASQRVRFDSWGDPQEKLFGLEKCHSG